LFSLFPLVFFRFGWAAFFFAITPQLLPAFFTEALPCRRVPGDAGRHFFPEDHRAAFLALYPGFVRKDFNFCAAIRALEQFNPKFTHILTGAFTIHRHQFLHQLSYNNNNTLQ
jgi:hypothetical protein